MAKDEAQQIIDQITKFLGHHPEGMHTTEIANNIGRNRITVGKYLDIMKAQGKVGVRKIGQAKVFFSSQSKKSKVLIVDDEPHVVNLISLTLGDKEYDLVEAEDGVQALAMVAKEKPDIIVLDLMMPNMNGYEVCQRLKENVLTQHIPIIILSAKSQVADKVKGIRIGADEYITKPFDPLELEARISALLKKEQRYRSLHPLTKLPDTIQSEKNLAVWEMKHKGMMLTIKLSNLDAYFRVCGYKEGGEGIALLAKFIKDTAEDFGSIEDMIGHLSYDEIIICSKKAEKIEKGIMAGFSKILPYLYSKFEIKGDVVKVDKKSHKVLSLKTTLGELSQK
jgi:DNA-binding response OmpR family regulator